MITSKDKLIVRLSNANRAEGFLQGAVGGKIPTVDQSLEYIRKALIDYAELLIKAEKGVTDEPSIGD
jgi:hypothetical protein